VGAGVWEETAGLVAAAQGAAAQAATRGAGLVAGRGAGPGAVVSEETAGLVARAQAAARATGGRFDAMVPAAVVAAGYDRAVGVVTVAPTTGFDPGGIAKGTPPTWSWRSCWRRGRRGRA